MRFIICILLLACQTTGQPENVDKRIWKKNLQMTVNGKSGNGVMVVPLAQKYTIDIDLPSKSEVVMLANCSRDRIKEKSGWTDRNHHRFEVYPFQGLETIGSCLIKISALDLQGVNGWGMIDFENEDLEASVMCNGEYIQAHGVSLCQARAGTIQRILFSVPTDMEPDSDLCEKPEPLKTMNGYNLKISPDICVYYFKSNDSDEYHRLTTFGYNDVFLESISPKNN